jgi:hypothetical protein
MDLLDTVRLLAAGNMVPTDAGMACFDSKYTYQFWRPITAIRNAGSTAIRRRPPIRPGRHCSRRPITRSTPRNTVA